MKKLLAFALVAAMLTAMMLTGCGPKLAQSVDANKTQLYIGTYGGGVGTEWLEKAIADFEAKYAETSFEEGKKGVQIMIRTNKTDMEGETLKDVIGLADTKEEIYFTEGVFYQTYVSRGLMLDLTDYINADLTEFGESESIADKMSDELKSAMSIDGKIYALPFWQGCYGMVYNATLFDENGWYFDKNGNFTDAAGNLGTGPDGQSGTADDGQPRTYDEFFKLLAEIRKDGCVPLSFAGASQDYLTWLLAEMAVDYMGVDAFKTNYSLDGTVELIKAGTADFTGDTVTYQAENVAITPKNGYELARQPGLAHAIKFAERLMQNTTNYNANSCLSGSYKISDAQLEFVGNTASTKLDPIAIMIDGSWWENEASAAFQNTYQGSKYDSEMEYKWMSFPKATEDKVGQKSTLVASVLDSYSFIKANISESKKDLAVKFLQFVHTDAQMAQFTETTGLAKPYDYAVDQTKLTSFTQSMMASFHAADLVTPMGNSDLYRAYCSDYRLAYWMRTAYDPSKGAIDNLASILTTKSGGDYVYTAADCYNGMLTYRRDTRWDAYESLIK